MMFLWRSLASLARAYKLHVHDFLFWSVHLGVSPPPPPLTKMLAMLLTLNWSHSLRRYDSLVNYCLYLRYRAILQGNMYCKNVTLYALVNVIRSVYNTSCAPTRKCGTLSCTLHVIGTIWFVYQRRIKNRETYTLRSVWSIMDWRILLLITNALAITLWGMVAQDDSWVKGLQ